MAKAPKPYDVTFSSDAVPTVWDHSQPSPGPATGADRAGYTRVTVKPRLAVEWDMTDPGSDGCAQMWAKVAQIEFRLRDFVVGISSDYAVGSCAYEATVKHELDAHVRRPIEIFYKHEAFLIGLLESAPLPTKSKPVRVKPALADGEQEKLIAPVAAAIAATRDRIAAALKADRAHQDAPASYDLVYNQCTPAQWASGR